MELEAQICKKNEEKIGAGKNNTGEKKEEPLKEFVPFASRRVLFLRWG